MLRSCVQTFPFANRHFQFKKRDQLFIAERDEPLPSQYVSATEIVREDSLLFGARRMVLFLGTNLNHLSWFRDNLTDL